MTGYIEAKVRAEHISCVSVPLSGTQELINKMASLKKMHIFLAELCLFYFPLYRYENEQPFRKAVEDEINSLYKVIDDANLTKMDLESQIESMKEELTLLSKTHEEVSPGSGHCRAKVCLLHMAGIVHWAEQALQHCTCHLLMGETSYCSPLC